MTTIVLKKKIDRKKHLPKCLFCDANDFEDVSNIEYPYMYKCKQCGKITAIQFDL